MRGIGRAGLCALALALVVGCGSDTGGDESKTTSTTKPEQGFEGNRSTDGARSKDALRIYSSQPLLGSAGPQGRDLIAAERLALAETGSRVAGRTIDYVAMNDATRAAGRWDPDRVTANAMRARRDPRAIAYLGEYNSGASEVSAPILNRAGVLQVSPANSAEQLTRRVVFDPGSPFKYYPTGRRTFGRVVPIERVQAAAQGAVMRGRAVDRLYLINDSSVDGRTIAGEVAREARRHQIEVITNRAVDPASADAAQVAALVAHSGADALFFGGTAQNFAIKLWHELHALEPRMSLFAPDGVGDDAFAAAVGPGPGRRTTTTAVPLARRAYPPAGRAFFTRFRSRYGRDPESYAIYGYEAMRAVLQAIRRTGGENDRRAVVRAFFQTRMRHSVLGSYAITRTGDTTLLDYGIYRVRGGRLAFVDKVAVEPLNP